VPGLFFFAKIDRPGTFPFPFSPWHFSQNLTDPVLFDWSFWSLFGPNRPGTFSWHFFLKTLPYDGKKPVRVAVSEFEVKNCEEDLGGSAAEWLRIDLAASDVIIMIAREKMEKLLAEQQMQMTGITSSEDAALIGNMLNVKVMIFGTVSKVGSEYYVSVKCVDVETGKVEVTAEEVASGKAGVRLAVKKLAMTLDPAREK